MDQPKKVYWKGLEELRQDPGFVSRAQKEFPKYLPVKDAYGEPAETDANHSRRDFLKLMGFGLAAVGLAACETPVRNAIPYLNKPEEVDPGIPNYYASVFTEGGQFCPVLIKTRDGRPIFVEGNPSSSFTKGKISAQATASLMSLYDLEKVQHPTKVGQEIRWEVLDGQIIKELNTLSAVNLPFFIVTPTILSPSTKKLFADFKVRFPNTQVVSYDAQSYSGIRSAHAVTHGKSILPTYNFEAAQTIVGINADFLADWISPVEHTVQYAEGRKVNSQKAQMSQHFQFESYLSITGGQADYRSPIKPSQVGLVVAKLYNLIARATDGAIIEVPDITIPNLDKAAQALLKVGSNSLVVCGSDDREVQILINLINRSLQNYGTTIKADQPSFQKQGDEAAFADFVEKLKAKEVGGVLFYNTNPVYNHVLGSQIAQALKNVSLSIATGSHLDETARLCIYHTPDRHYAESWGDAEAKAGMFALSQPTIRPIFNIRQVQTSLLRWSGNTSTYYDYLKNFWRENIFKLQTEITDFEYFWKKSLHDGIVELSPSSDYVSLNQSPEVENKLDFNLADLVQPITTKYKVDNQATELYIYSNNLIGTGEQANNPILQETPDPISRICWGNYVAVSPKLAAELKAKVVETTTQFAKVTVGSQTFKLPILIQPGLPTNTIAVKTGYGRANVGKVAKEAGGINAFRLKVGGSNAILSGVSIENTGEAVDVAQTQTYHTIMERESIIQETSLAAYQKNPQAGRFKPHVVVGGQSKSTKDVSLWQVNRDDDAKAQSKHNWLAVHPDNTQRHTYPNHHWGMVIDLNSCTGCGACVTACTLENNVPVVGKQEIINRREMHWLRIDRYYSSTEDAKSFAEMERAAENPEVVFQPMMCQHCNNAPCETVCPVAATTHSSEGLNQMTYNRCVGTKYCANNCPYKVRRFNWFKYHTNEEFDYHLNNNLGRMVLNPDVTVRSRGVMEKCSMCVQRIQLGKLQARLEKRLVKDGEVKTACSNACPGGAITFGDLNDPKSEVRQLMEAELEGRAYHVLAEIATKPNVWYLTKVRNKG